MGIYPVLRMEGSLRATGGTFKVPSRVGGNGLAPWGFSCVQLQPLPCFMGATNKERFLPVIVHKEGVGQHYRRLMSPAG